MERPCQGARRLVLDKTGLAGTYDFDLEFTPDETIFGGILGKGTGDCAEARPVSAVQQQLGLRLEVSNMIRQSPEAMPLFHVFPRHIS